MEVPTNISDVRRTLKTPGEKTHQNSISAPIDNKNKNSKDPAI